MVFRPRCVSQRDMEVSQYYGSTDFMAIRFHSQSTWVVYYILSLILFPTAYLRKKRPPSTLNILPPSRLWRMWYISPITFLEISLLGVVSRLLLIHLSLPGSGSADHIQGYAVPFSVFVTQKQFTRHGQARRRCTRKSIWPATTKQLNAA